MNFLIAKIEMSPGANGKEQLHAHLVVEWELQGIDFELRLASSLLLRVSLMPGSLVSALKDAARSGTDPWLACVRSSAKRLPPTFFLRKDQRLQLPPCTLVMHAS